MSHRRTTPSIVLSVLLIAVASTDRAQTTSYVDDDGPPGGDGTAWATGLNDLQDALAVAVNGDEIRMAQGEEKPDGGSFDRTVSLRLIDGVFDERDIANGRFFSIGVPDLVGYYYGISGEGHSAEFDFAQEFARIDDAWLHVRGLSDVSTGDSAALQFYSRVDGVFGPSPTIPPSTEFDECVPLATPDTILDGTGTVLLGINVLNCCDHQAFVEEAELWLDAVAIPAPTDLAAFAALQRCFSGTDNGVPAGCESFDYDHDIDVDLSDYGIFRMAFNGP